MVQCVIRFFHAKGKNPTLDLKKIDWRWQIPVHGHFCSASGIVRGVDGGFWGHIIMCIMLSQRQNLILWPGSIHHYQSPFLTKFKVQQLIKLIVTVFWHTKIVPIMDFIPNFQTVKRQIPWNTRQTEGSCS